MRTCRRVASHVGGEAANSTGKTTIVSETAGWLSNASTLRSRNRAAADLQQLLRPAGAQSRANAAGRDDCGHAHGRNLALVSKRRL
jgi:hypothetical protein